MLKKVCLFPLILLYFHSLKYNRFARFFQHIQFHFWFLKCKKKNKIHWLEVFKIIRNEIQNSTIQMLVFACFTTTKVNAVMKSTTTIDSTVYIHYRAYLYVIQRRILLDTRNDCLVFDFSTYSNKAEQKLSHLPNCPPLLLSRKKKKYFEFFKMKVDSQLHIQGHS